MHNCKLWQMAKRHDVDGVARGLMAGRCISVWTFLVLPVLALITSEYSGYFLTHSLNGNSKVPVGVNRCETDFSSLDWL